MWSRREVLRTAGIVAAGRLLRAEDARELRLRRAEGAEKVALPLDFTGLGYEMSSVARPGLLSRDNAAYVRLVRSLGQGVIRVGGIVADFTWYEESGKPMDQPKHTVITRDSLRQFRGFLDAVGWRAIWSLNFGKGTLEDAVTEAKAVSKALQDRLLAVELGNEVENYGRGAVPLRKAGYSYEDYREEAGRWRQALLAAVPGLHFAGPDTAASVEWVEKEAAGAPGEVQMLTTHYYRGGQTTGTQEQLLKADAALKEKLDRLRRAARESGVPWRMCETNSFFGGGRPGVSDTLTGALWTLDYMLLLAQAGCAGVNMETGVNQLGFISSYSPIKEDEAGKAVAGAPYYGMLAFAMAARGVTHVAPVEFQGDAGDVTGYGLESPAGLKMVVIVNKEIRGAVRVSLAELGVQRGYAIRLAGRAADSKDDVRLAGMAVDASGNWSARQQERVAGPVVLVPAASAALVFVTG